MSASLRQEWHATQQPSNLKHDLSQSSRFQSNWIQPLWWQTQSQVQWLRETTIHNWHANRQNNFRALNVTDYHICLQKNVAYWDWLTYAIKNCIKLFEKIIHGINKRHLYGKGKEGQSDSTFQLALAALCHQLIVQKAWWWTIASHNSWLELISFPQTASPYDKFAKCACNELELWQYKKVTSISNVFLCIGLQTKYESTGRHRKSSTSAYRTTSQQCCDRRFFVESRMY